MPIPTKCIYPGCNEPLHMTEWGDGRVIPGSPYCEHHTAIMNTPKSKVERDKFAEHRAMWGKYGFAVETRLPQRIVRYHKDASDDGMGLDGVKDIIELVWGSRKGAVFQGATGVGKTMTMFMLSEFILRETGRIPVMAYCPRLRLELTEAARSDDPSSKTRIVNRLVHADRLFLDDIGSTEMSPSYEEALKLIIEERSRLGLPVYCSLQQTGEEFITGNGRTDTSRRDAIHRRLCDDCLAFKITTP